MEDAQCLVPFGLVACDDSDLITHIGKHPLMACPLVPGEIKFKFLGRCDAPEHPAWSLRSFSACTPPTLPLLGCGGLRAFTFT